MKVIYVAGLGRSGSTLLTRLMGQVAGVCAVGEAHHLWRTGAPRAATDELCGCGRTYAECGFWPGRLREVFGGETPLAAMAELADRVARIRRIPRLLRGGDAAFEKAVSDYGDVWRRLYASVASATGAKVVFDASKDLGSLYFLRRVPEIEVALVHLVRDPRAVAHSWSRRKRRPEFVDREVWMNTHGSIDVAWRWLYSNRLAERAKELFADHLTLRYEDFVEQPRATIERLCSLVDLQEVDLSFIDGQEVELRRTNCTLSGNPMRFDEGHLTVRPDLRWMQDSSAARRALVGSLTWWQRRRYGYGGSGT